MFNVGFLMSRGIAVLTQREKEVLSWLAKGKTALEIGMILSITQRTVKAHVRNMKDKLSCVSLFQLGQAYQSLTISEKTE